jgi:MtN3 and saliva related transmembrane protein
MPSFFSFIGALAAVFTSLSYLPQVMKALPRGSTGDLSLKTLACLTAGLSLWICYGVMKGDWILVLANAVGAALSAVVLICKLRDVHTGT